MKDWLREGFEYDLWANLMWLETLPRFQNATRAEEVMSHIHFAQELWLDRILDSVGDIETYRHFPNTAESFAATTDKWMAWLVDADLEQVREFTRLDGSTFTFSLANVARHMINHGTYHRGHLRGLAQAEGWEEFEDTDFARWLRDMGRH